MIQPGVFYDYEDEESDGNVLRLPSPIPGLKSWQSLVVAILFALDVALCGLMILFMTGRMALPFLVQIRTHAVNGCGREAAFFSLDGSICNGK